jgi:hypothetical protein
MKDYRLYCLNRAGKIDFAEWIQAASDDDAVRKAERAKPDAAKCEIWEQNRLVAKLNGSRQFDLY